MFLLNIRPSKAMCDNAILENGETLEPLPDCYKNQQMCDKAVDNYPHVLKFVLNYYMTQKMCDKAVNTYSSKLNMLLIAIRLKKCVIKQLIDVFCIWFYYWLVCYK